MDYFRAHSLPVDAGVVAAFDSEVTPIADLLGARRAEIFPEFVRCYAQVRALPRGRRRTLQRRLAAARDASLPAHMRRRLAGSIAGAALLLALAELPAAAGTITVSPKTPANTAVDGKCSLLEAIINANNGNDTAHPECSGATPGPNTINLPSGSVTVPDSRGNYYGSETGFPPITTDITIAGNGAKIARKAPGLFRLFFIGNGGHLTFEN
ncbi:MAG TPA: hypothetical protein VHL99_04630, partial [Candidatus Binatia bacterium]|nr:hypothetical protein [Candidatus Binatia bacterium]